MSVRRRLFGSALALGLVASSLTALAVPAHAADTYRVGRGVADITGEPGEVGMMGYGSSQQKSSGVHTRQFARSFIVESGDRRVLMVVTDTLTGTDAVRTEVLNRLRATYGDRWGEANVMISGIHTHATPGGTTDYSLYNVTTMGFHSATFNAQVDGIVASVASAEKDLAPATVALSRSSLTDASVNRSRAAFDLNPQWVRDRLPNGSDPASTTMSFTRGGRVDGAINWFATHPTSLTAGNTLISGDNKGHAQWLWEHGAGVDHTRPGAPAMVAAFPMSNGADQSPNLNLRPGSGPTEDEFANAAEIGRRQYAAAYGQMSGPKQVQGGGVDARIVYVDMEHATAPGAFTQSGRDEQTCGAVLGASFGAGSVEDGGGGPAFLHEGAENNPFFSALTRTQYDVDPALKACQAPKATLFDVGRLGGVQTKLPVQVFRIGGTWVLGMPGEVTAASGVRLRQTVADAVGTAPENVVVQAVTNAYGHYFTTPEEYASQQYEGGATLFGRNTVPALQGVVRDLSLAIRDGRPVGLGDRPTRPAHVESAVGKVLYDVPGTQQFGDLLEQPADTARGATVSAKFQGAHPNNNLRHGDTYLEVQRREGDDWVKVTDDNDPATRFRWERYLAAQSHVTLSWQVPADAPAGEYRLVYRGDWKDGGGRLHPFTGTTGTFRVA